MKEQGYIVVGGGLAGLYTAHILSRKSQVLLMARAGLEESNSYFAQGGMAAVTDAEDTTADHFKDTIVAGRGLCREDAVSLLVEEAPKRIDDLISLGMKFDEENGHLALGLEGGHHHHRILHAGGDATGRLVTQFMISQVLHNERITILDHHFLSSLVVKEGCCLGVKVLNEHTYKEEYYGAKAVVLATGGCGALYIPTTNPPFSLGDGTSAAFRAGARLMDLEFMQFHPTALYSETGNAFLISEAVRGEGAYLLNEKGERFMKDKYPLAELSPRDEVARAIFSEMQRSELPYVTLSTAHISRERLMKRFPTIAAHCKKLGLDFATGIPVAPAAHYTVGGIATNLNGATNIEGLYAVGEAASTGVMGANRLASNSLIECIVFGYRIARHIMDNPQKDTPCCTELPDLTLRTFDAQRELRWQKEKEEPAMRKIGKILMKHCGIVRTEASLNKGLQKLDKLEKSVIGSAKDDHTLFAREVLSARIKLAQTIFKATLLRTESRGVHYRADFPETNSPEKAYRTEIIGDNIKHILISQYK